MMIRLIKTVYVRPFEICYLFLFHFNSDLVVHSLDTHFLGKNRLRFFCFVKILSKWMILKTLANIRTYSKMSGNSIIVKDYFPQAC